MCTLCCRCVDIHKEVRGWLDVDACGVCKNPVFVWKSYMDSPCLKLMHLLFFQLLAQLIPDFVSRERCFKSTKKSFNARSLGSLRESEDDKICSLYWTSTGFRHGRYHYTRASTNQKNFFFFACQGGGRGWSGGLHQPDFSGDSALINPPLYWTINKEHARTRLTLIDVVYLQSSETFLNLKVLNLTLT